MKYKPKKNRSYRHNQLDDGEGIGHDKKTDHRRERREFNPNRIRTVYERLKDTIEEDNVDD